MTRPNHSNNPTPTHSANEITLEEAAESLSMDTNSLRRFMDRGLLTYRSVGYERLIDVADIEAFKANRERAQSDVQRALKTSLNAASVKLDDKDMEEIDNL